jgi:hypothetical protein
VWFLPRLPYVSSIYCRQTTCLSLEAIVQVPKQGGPYISATTDKANERFSNVDSNALHIHNRPQLILPGRFFHFDHIPPRPAANVYRLKWYRYTAG